MKTKLMVLIVIIIGSCSVAGAWEKPHTFQLYPYFGGWFGDDYVDDGWLLGGRAGYAFTKRFVLEGGYEYSEGEFTDDDPERDVKTHLIHGDLLVHFLRSEKLTPYLLLGGGGIILEVKDVENPPDMAAFMWGLGMKYYFMENIALRAEARHLIIEDESADNILISGGLNFRFGGKKKAKPAPVDSDNDGVLDRDDRCPGTAPGIAVDRKGCELDSDGDTVPDSKDSCAGTPKGAKVDASGCELDSDGDTVPDSRDSCANTPANTPVDATGCPEAAPRVETDSDGDTVLDSADSCPETTPGVEVDAKGCEVVSERIVLRGVKFRTGSSRIEPKSYPIIDRAAQILKTNPHLKVEVQGYTDSVGSVSSNVRLSQARAKAVYDYLVKNGIAADRLSYKGYGPKNPIATNDTAEGRAENRRIEFKIIK